MSSDGKNCQLIHLQSREFCIASGEHKALASAVSKQTALNILCKGSQNHSGILLILFMVSYQGNKPSFTLDF
jgi:hypothetical protein